MAQANLSQPVNCVGFVVETAITDTLGKTTYQTSSIYRRHSDAERIAQTARKPYSYEAKIERTVVPVCTAFPLSDVPAGNAMRWADYLDACADEPVLERAA